MGKFNGYPDSVDLPEYRILPATVFGNTSNGIYHYSDHPLPIAHIKPEHLADLKTFRLTQSLSVLETFDRDLFLIRNIPMENNVKLGEPLAAGGYRIERAWVQTPGYDVRGVLTQVRSRPLDFLLDLKETVGDSEDEERIRKKADTADATSMFNHAIFGPHAHTTIVVGNHNIQAIRKEAVKVAKGVFNTLAQALTNAGLPADEIESLETAISEDESHGQTTPFEGKTGGWFTKLLGRAAKGGLKIGTDVVSTVATKALTDYFTGGV